MKTSNAVLIASAVGAVATGLAERRHRQRLTLDAEVIHQQLLADIATDPQQQAIWATDGLPPQEYAEAVHCNRQISLLAVKFRTGLLNRHALTVQARWLMQRPAARAYWRRFGSFRKDEAVDRWDRHFVSVLAQEFTAIPG
jgi:hypothetical protein